MKKRIEEVDVKYAGPMLSDYFQGASATHTVYDDVYVGAASTIYEAFEDAAEMVAMCESLGDQALEMIGEASDHFERDATVEDEGGGEESVFFVMIYVKWEE